MKRIILISVFMVCLAEAAHAGMYTFSFDTLSNGDTIAATETYMESIYGSDITIWTGDGDGQIISNDSTEDYELGPDMWVKADEGTNNGDDGIKFSFNDVQITSVSFDWATKSDKFKAEADDIEFFVKNSSSSASGTVTTYTFASPVTTLYFHDHGNGWIGIDNLVVTTASAPPPTPVPGAALLGLIGLSAAGIKLRNKSNQ